MRPHFIMTILILALALSPLQGRAEPGGANSCPESSDADGTTGSGPAAGSFEANDPRAPLTIRAQTDKARYRHGETIKITVTANKDFFLDLMYVDAGGRKIKLIPNRYSAGNLFQGGQVHTIPLDDKEFALEVDCLEGKCGKELIIATASTQPFQYPLDGSEMPILGTGLVEYKGELRGRIVKLLAGSDHRAHQSQDRECAESRIEIFTGK
jgi:hypothetical protein